MLPFTIGALIPSKARAGWNWFSSLLNWTRLPLGQRGASQKMDGTAVFVWNKTTFGTARSNKGNGMEFLLYVLLLPDPDVVFSHAKTRSRSAMQSILLFLAVPEAVLSHTKVRSISSAGLFLQRELFAGCQSPVSNAQSHSQRPYPC